MNIGKLFYGVVFQIGWLVCITQPAFISAFYTLAFVTVFFYQQWKSQNHLPSIFMSIFKITLLGLLLETISFSCALLTTTSPVHLTSQIVLPPLALIFLWINFAVALKTCFAFLFKSPNLSFLAISIATPINYYLGVKLSSNIQLVQPEMLSLCLITLSWIILWLLLINSSLLIGKSST